MESSSSTGHQDSSAKGRFSGSLPLWKKVLVSVGMLALESYITFEEIYLTTTLQRFRVPYVLLSLPGAISGGVGLFIVPLIGWASDRFPGSKRIFVIGTLSVLVIGMAFLIYVSSVNLYHPYLNITMSPNLSYPSSEMEYPDDLSVPTSEGGSEETRATLSLAGALAMAGFVLGDHGYDTSTSTVRIFIVSVSPPEHHDSLFLTISSLAAIGGCFTSLIGYFDLSVAFPQVEGQVLDKGDAQCLVQSVFFLVSIIVFATCTLLVTPSFFDSKKGDDVTSAHKSQKTGYLLMKEQDQFSINDSETEKLAKSLTVTDSGYESHQSVSSTAVTLTSKEDPTSDHGTSSDDALLTNHKKHEPHGELQSKQTNKKPHKESTGCCNKRRKSKFWIMTMTFFMVISMSCYLFYITNYVAQIIYEGDPRALPGSEPYNQYVLGTRMASLSMLAFYVVFVIFNLFHSKILDKIGMKAEFVITSISIMVVTLLLVVTKSMVLVFINVLPMAAFRSCCMTLPFILINQVALEEQCEERLERTGDKDKGTREVEEDSSSSSSISNSSSSNSNNRSRDNSSSNNSGGDNSNAGSAVASITVMLPASYCVICILTGPLIYVTGNTALPIYISVGSFGIGALTTPFVFD